MKIIDLGIQPYEKTWQSMKQFTQNRHDTTPDELWLLEHYPVYTQGQAGKPEHLLNPKTIPVIQSDRGGQVTYHGPGQMVGYLLMDIKRQQIGIRTLVCQLEQLIIKVLNHYHITANTQCGAPGVYVAEKKIASIGLRVKNGCTYHGIALNVDMNIEPFTRINPCGFTQLKMTQIVDFYPRINLEDVKLTFKHEVTRHFS